MNRDFWRGAISVALVLGTLSFLDSVGTEPLPAWLTSPRDLDLPKSKRPVDQPQTVALREVEIPMSPEPPAPPDMSMMDDECSDDDCVEYAAGFSWAAMRAVSDSRQCPDRGDKFVDGCKSFVRHMRGENDDSEEHSDEENSNESDSDDSDNDSGDHERR